MSQEAVNKAIELIKSGDKNQAASILKGLVKQDPKDESVWSLLYTCVSDIEQKRYCLKKIIEINPNNLIALDALEKLTGDEVRPAIKSESKRIDVGEQKSDKDVAASNHMPISNATEIATNVSPTSRQKVQKNTKKCPFCAEEIQADAVICRFCKKNLNSRDSGKGVNAKPARKSNSGTIIAFTSIFLVVILIGVGIFFKDTLMSGLNIDTTGSTNGSVQTNEVDKQRSIDIVKEKTAYNRRTTADWFGQIANAYGYTRTMNEVWQAEAISKNEYKVTLTLSLRDTCSGSWCEDQRRENEDVLRSICPQGKGIFRVYVDKSTALADDVCSQNLTK